MFKNEWLLDVDLKFKYSSLIPVFRRGDTAILKFRFHDNGDLYDISTYEKAELTIITPSGATMEATCDSENLNGMSVIKFQFEPIHSMEIGTYNVILTLSNNNSKISVQPFKVRFFDNPPSSNLNLLQLIQDLQAQINNLDNLLDSTVSIQDKGKPNGIASLDKDGKIPESQLPNYIKDHINKEAYLEGVHGLRINEEGIIQYETSTGKWQNVGFDEEASSEYNPLKLSTNINDGHVTLSYKGKGFAVLQKWIVGDKFITDFALHGTEFTGLTFNVTNIGIHTIYFKDEFGNEYVHKFNVVIDDLKEPIVNIDVEKGVGTVDSEEDISVIKWDKGIHDVTHFRNNGTIITDNSFVVSEAGTYTLYYKLVSGLEYVKVFTVNESQLDISLPIVNSSVDILNNIATIAITASDEGSGIHSIKKPDGSIVYAATTTYTTTTNGSYDFILSDKAGNQLTHTVMVDQIDLDPPIISLTSAPQTFTNKDVTVNVTISDVNEVPIIKWASGNQTTAFFQNNGNTISNNSFIVSDNGIYTVYTKDRFGNAAVKSITINNIDKIAPIATITKTPLGNSVIINVQASDSQSGIEHITLPDNSTVNGSTATYSVLANNYYTFIITDKAGNSTTYDVQVTELDSIPPTIALTFTPTQFTNGNVTINVNASDENGIATVKWASGNQPISYFTNNGTLITNSFTVASNGTFTVYARDTVGNESVKAITINNIDKIPPTATATQTTSGNSKIITVTANDNGSGVNRIILPNNVIDYFPSTTYTATSNGNFEFKVYDNAENLYTLNINVSGISVNTYKDIYTMRGAMYVIHTNGDVYANGNSEWYRLGDGSITYSDDDNIPSKVLVSNVIKVQTGVAETYFLNSSGELFFTGANFKKEFTGLDKTTIEIPTKIPIVTTVADIKIDQRSGSNVFVKLKSGDWYGWGDNDYGCLGFGHTNPVLTPTKITAFSNTITDISIDHGCTYFLLSNGQVYAVGNNHFSQLGLGDTINRSTPTLIPNLSGIKSIKSCFYRGYFVKNNGEVYGVGTNLAYELGLGDTINRITPTLIPNLSGVEKIEAGINSAIALKSDGTAYGWGFEIELGLGSLFEYTTTPTKLPLTNIRNVSLNDDSIVFITNDNKIYGSGYNYRNLFADNTLINKDGHITTTSLLTNWQ